MQIGQILKYILGFIMVVMLEVCVVETLDFSDNESHHIEKRAAGIIHCYIYYLYRVFYNNILLCFKRDSSPINLNSVIIY